MIVVIHKLYKNHVIRIQLDKIEEIAKISKGVRQGSILSTLFFNIYILKKL